MARRTWEIIVGGKPHQIRLRHGYWSGKREVWVDNQLVVQRKKFIDYGSRYSFDIDQHKGELHVLTNGFVYRYLLFVDDVPYLAKEDSATHRPPHKLIQRKINDHEYWRELAQHTGLRHIGVPDDRSFVYHRLVGQIRGYLVVVRHSLNPENRRPLISILIRYSPAMDVEQLKNQIVDDPALPHLSSKARGTEWVVEEGSAWATLSYQPQKERADQLAVRIGQIADVIAKYARPLAPDICEGRNCRTRTDGALKVVFVNNWPLLLCQSCLAEIPGVGKESQQAYRDAPSGLLKGALAGLGVALLGSIVWAAIALLFEIVAAVIGVIVFVEIVKAMDKVGTKRTFKSILVAAGLTVFGTFIGSYLTVLWLVLRDTSSSISLDTVSWLLRSAWEVLSANPRLLSTSIAICLLGVVPYLYVLWRQQEDYLARVFAPAVEVVGDKWF